jgi:hypothetical protein
VSDVTIEQQIELVTRIRLNGLDVLGGLIAGREQHVATCDAVLSTLRTHTELETDARRYRWLRSPDSGIDAISHREPISNTGATCVTLLEGDKLDAAIDSSLGSK